MDEWKDEIVEEVRSWREAYARRFGYDVRAICRDLKSRQDEGRRKVVRADVSKEGESMSNRPQG
jgi:hypothetical protein